MRAAQTQRRQWYALLALVLTDVQDTLCQAQFAAALILYLLPSGFAVQVYPPRPDLPFAGESTRLSNNAHFSYASLQFYLQAVGLSVGFLLVLA